MKKNRLFLTFLLLMTFFVSKADKFRVEVLKPQIGTLQDKTRYVVKSNTTISAKNNHGKAALTVADGATVILEIQAGCTLELTGCDYHAGDYAATPGLRLNEGCTLIICGDGTLKATGGMGGGAADGGAGQYGQVDTKAKTEWYKAGDGGAGGRGASGGAPGIGTDGAMGGAGGASAIGPRFDEHNDGTSGGTAGNSGKKGSKPKSMGNLIIMGHAKILCERGAKEHITVTNAPGGGDGHTDYKTWKDYRCAGGGGGGQGGESIQAPYSIGAGAPGSGGGGSGGSGGVDREYYKSNLVTKSGYGGHGGMVLVGSSNGGDGGRYPTSHNSGGAGGEGGAPGDYAGNGSVYAAVTVEFGASTTVEKRNPINISMLPSELKFRITGAGKDIELYQGMQLPKQVDMPDDSRKPSPTSSFIGYYDQYGNLVYKANCKINSELPESTWYHVIDKEEGDIVALLVEDIVLTPKYNDAVYVTVNHFIEDPNTPISREIVSNKQQYLTSRAQYYIPYGKSERHTFNAWMNADGTPNDSLKSEYYAVVGSRSARKTLDPSETTEYTVNFYYRRTIKNLTYDYGELGESEFEQRLINKDTYTKAGEVKYGAYIELPAIRQKGGKGLKEWSPTNITYMPNKDVTFKAVMEDVTFGIHVDEIDRGATEASLSFNKYNNISYGETVTGECSLKGDAHIMNLSVVRRENGEAVPVTFVTDSTFTFTMPDDNINVSIRFVRMRYNVTSAASNMKGTVVAVTNGNGKIYTDNRDVYPVDASHYGGTLADFPLYSYETIYVDAFLDNANYKEHAQATLLYNDGRAMEFTKAEQTLIDDGGMMRPFYEFKMDKADNLAIEILWKLQTPKTISYRMGANQEGHHIKVADIFSNGKSTIDTKHEGASACAGDIVCLDIDTDDEDFNPGNISVEYSTADNQRYYVPVKDYIDQATGKKYYIFFMPAHHVLVMLNGGKKQPITVSEELEKQKFYVAPAAVPQSTVPFFIFNKDEEDTTIRPVVNTADQGTVDILDLGKTLFRYGSNVNMMTMGAFIMPDGPVSISDAKQNAKSTNSINAIGIEGSKGKMYNIMGVSVDDDYKGIVIVNGRKYIKR